MNILAIPVQSISDLITNSSSEVFILDTGKTCEEVNDILKGFTSGFAYPEVFSLKDYREWRKKLRSGEIEEGWSYPGTIFEIANGWLKDPEDEEDVLEVRMNFLFEPFEVHDYDINRVLAEEEDDAVDCIDWKTLHRHSYWFKNALWDISKEFLKSYDGPKPTVWEISKAEDVRRLDGKVLVVSNDDNSIPYDTWDKINSLFNGWNIHLG